MSRTFGHNWTSCKRALERKGADVRWSLIGTHIIRKRINSKLRREADKQRISEEIALLEDVA